MVSFARSFSFSVFFVLLFAIHAAAENKCSAKGVMAGLDFSISHCAVAFYKSSSSVTLWFSSSPITPEEEKVFQISSYSGDFKNDPSGKKRTMITMAFCPGGGKEIPSPGEVKSVEINFKHADAFFLGPQEQWVLKPPQTKELKVEKLSGDLKPGGSLSGRITGALTSDNKPFSWEVDFEFTLPEKVALAGPGCGD